VTAASSLPAGPAGQALRRWTRFTPAERIGRSVFYLVALIAVVWSVKTIEVIPEFLYDAPEQTVDLFRRMWPFDWPFWNKMVAESLVETFHSASLGKIIDLVLSVPVALMAARNVSRSTSLNLFA
jgi:phosphonate transport system permease protein